jgi:hypothetical protein
MTRFSSLMLSATLACCAAAAQAGTTSAPADARITNGGTGFIGLTESAGMPRQPFQVRWAADTSPIVPAGEASTLVKGRPNVDPFAPGMGTYQMDAAHPPMTPELRTLGNSRVVMGVAGAPAGAHQAWGTPD